MTQSVELLLDPGSEAAVIADWAVLADAGLPSEQRALPSPSHRPHITLWAGQSIAAEADQRLPALFAGLGLDLRLGAFSCFTGPRNRYVVVRQIVVTAQLLELQRAVLDCLGEGAASHFGPGAWTPHVTLARRVQSAQIGPVLDALADRGPEGDRMIRCDHARRWDGDRKQTRDLGR